MGGIWYAEKFTIPTAECSTGYPIAYPNGPASYCSDNTCGCGIPLKFGPVRDCSDLYLPACIPYDQPIPPGVPHETRKLSGPHHLQIRTINGEPVTTPTYVACYYMQTTAPRKPPVFFWIGWQCTTPNPLPGRRVNAISTYVPDCHAVVRVLPGGSGMGANARDILIRLTKDGCSP
jgi:hypothetical protein